MAAPKGHPRYGGRVKGVQNKGTAEVLAILHKHKFNVIEEMIELYHRTGNEDGTSATAAKILTELASYIYPKRKAIEHSGVDGEGIRVIIEDYMKK